VGLRGEVHHHVVPGQQLAQQLRIRDVALHETQSHIRQRQIGAIARIGQQIQNRHGGTHRARVFIL
jgi:hypothetical protein